MRWLVFLTFLCAEIRVFGCPGYIQGQTFRPDLPSKPRNLLRMYRYVPDAKTKWQDIPVQIDPVNHLGQILFYEQDYPWWQDPLSRQDRIAFRVETFGATAPNTAEPPCDAMTPLYEIIDGLDKTKRAYLVWCKAGQESPIFTPPVIHLEKEREVKASMFSYRYDKENHLMFSEVVLQPYGKNPSVAASHSQQLMYGNVKNFFNLEFDQTDVESELLDIRPGPVGLLGRLTFFLKILFFRIDLQLNTAVNFFSDAAHVPMIINFPVDARQRLYPGSGILFTWNIDPTLATMAFDEALMPEFDFRKPLAGTKGLADVGLKYCRGRDCKFVMKGEVNGFQWAMEFIIPSSLVEKGFFPFAVRDTRNVLRGLQWDDDAAFAPNRVGVYLEVSGLPKGEHAYDFWIRAVESGKKAPETCPWPVIASRPLKLKTPKSKQ